MSTEARFLILDDLPEAVLPNDAKSLIKMMVQVKPESRISIDEIMANGFFDSVRDLKAMPPLDELYSKLRDICDDFIKRGNVYKLEGEQSLQAKLKTFEALLPEAVPDYWQRKLAHVFAQAKFFVFDIDPCHELLEVVKSEVNSEAKARREANAANKSASESSSDEERKTDEWQKSEEQTDTRNEPELPWSTMGCSFDPEEFKKLKLEVENKQK